MNDKLRSKDKEYLFKAVLQLKTVEECYNFFDDLCTIQELESISQRLHVAKLLTDGLVYSDIVAKTGASTATISRVNRSIKGGNDGYSVVFERLAKLSDED
ncbi:MAG: TrpR-like protein, YerC/YecD [Eubacterium sp.]|nr:TrpR-like protein, YerC/YecD [Eubacterium sp.]